MKKFAIFFLASLMAIPFLLQAQNPQRPQMTVEERVKRTIDRLTPELKLTEQQVKDITPLYTEFYTELDKLRSAGTPPSPEDRQKMMTTRDDKLKKILDEAQMKKLKEIEEQMRQQRGQGRPNGLGN